MSIRQKIEQIFFEQCILDPDFASIPIIILDKYLETGFPGERTGRTGIIVQSENNFPDIGMCINVCSGNDPVSGTGFTDLLFLFVYDRQFEPAGFQFFIFLHISHSSLRLYRHLWIFRWGSFFSFCFSLFFRVNEFWFNSSFENGNLSFIIFSNYLHQHVNWNECVWIPWISGEKFFRTPIVEFFEDTSIWIHEILYNSQLQ